MSRSTDSKKSAIVQGEFHASNKDVEVLLKRDLQEWDTLLVEGRDPVYNLQNSRFGFVYYTAGAMFLTTILMYFHKFLGKFRISQEDPIEDAEIDTNRCIDAEHREIWSFTDKWLRWTFLILAALSSLAILIQPEGVVQISSKLFSWFPYRQWYSYLLFFPTLPVLVHVLAIINPTNSNKRNQVMVENIIEYSKCKDYDKVLILVGEMHREGVSNGLEERGWTIESNRTHSKIGRAISWIYSLFGDWE